MRLSTLIAAVSGAIVGSIVTYFVTKSKAETYIQTEIDKYKEEAGHTAPIPYAQSRTIVETTATDITKEYDTSSAYMIDYNRPYIPDSDTKPQNKQKKPYEITFEEFDTDEEFMKQTYMVWPDGYVTDTMDNIITDAESIVGGPVLNEVLDGDIPEGYVRNEEIRMDFELIRAKDNYEDVIGVHPEED